MTFTEMLETFYRWDAEDNATTPWHARVRWTLSGVGHALVLRWASAIEMGSAVLSDRR